MTFFLYIIAGIIGGLLGGMGMGGGTLLIPILTIFFCTFQQSAQGANLVSFIPMAVVAIIIHAKNKLIDWKNIIYLIIPAAIISVLSSLFSISVSQKSLQVYFGIFLCVLGVFQIVMEIYDIKKEK